MASTLSDSSLESRGERQLPPHQRALPSFIRFGVHLHRRAPKVPEAPVIEVAGAVTSPLVIPLAELGDLPRREQVSDFHCVAGWSATGLHWQGIPFATFYREIIEPVLRPGAVVTHLVFEGLDGWRSSVVIDDALADDVLIADRLDGKPLTTDHGAPLRVVSPQQYGYVSTKHLCRIEAHTEEPKRGYIKYRRRRGRAYVDPAMLLLQPHPRARVWAEERHRYLPAWSLRTIYLRVFYPPIRWLSSKGAERER
jgi:DMSO/TMAO reductase YedYZ molybdopterin-dependent catalytic subunit